MSEAMPFRVRPRLLAVLSLARGPVRATPLAVALTLTCGATALTTGCMNEQAKAPLSYTADAKRAYDAGVVELESHNWLEAQNMFREVKRKYSYSKFARLAELRIADADFQQEKFTDAIREYRQFVHDHRSDAEEVSYARSKIAEAQYAQIAESILLPAGEERDQAVIMDAYKELRGYIHDYPDAKETPKMRELLSQVTARLVKHELYVARFYLQRDNYDAAVLRIQYALRNFSTSVSGSGADTSGDSGLEPEALLLLGETYLKMKKWTEAREAFGTLVRRYSRSGLTVPAVNYLEFMKTRGV
jgi:outer membrane protein assembly factor BamD